MSRTYVSAAWLNHSSSGGRGGYAFLLDVQISVDQPGVCVCWGGGGMGGGFVQFRLAVFIFFHHQDARYQLIYKNAILGSLR